MPTWIRVEDKSTGHQFDIAEQAFDQDAHKKVNASKRWPDLAEDNARPRPALYRTSKGMVTADGEPADEETQAGSPATTAKGTDR